MVENCRLGQLRKSIDTLNHLIGQGYSALDIIRTLNRMIMYNGQELHLSEQEQLELLKEIGLIHMRVVEGVETPLQLAACFARFCKLFARSKS